MPNKIVQHNIEKITDPSKDGLGYHAKGESIAGNAGHWQGLPCYAVRFHYDNATGEIKFFGNDCGQFLAAKNKAESWIGKSWEGIFRLVYDFENVRNRIVNVILHEEMPQIARQNLEETLREYNKRYGFEQGE